MMPCSFGINTSFTAQWGVFHADTSRVTSPTACNLKGGKSYFYFKVTLKLHQIPVIDTHSLYIDNNTDWLIAFSADEIWNMKDSITFLCMNVLVQSPSCTHCHVQQLKWRMNHQPCFSAILCYTECSLLCSVILVSLYNFGKRTLIWDCLVKLLFYYNFFSFTATQMKNPQNAVDEIITAHMSIGPSPWQLRKLSAEEDHIIYGWKL